MLPSPLCGRLRSSVYLRILAGWLILTGTGCWAVWGPVIGVSAAGGTTAVVVATKSKASPTAR